MKKPRLFLLTLLLVIASVLSACSGGGSAATSWPGLTVSTDLKTAYVAYNQQVFAIDLANGSEKWRYPQQANNKITFFAPPALTENGQLIVGGYNNLLYSLNAENGQPTQGSWPFAGATNRYIASPLAIGSTIFAPNGDEKIYAVSLDGKEQWLYKTQQPLWATPAVSPDGQTIYQPSMDHHIYALNAGNGQLVWKTEDLGGAIVGTPTLGSDGRLYVGTFAHEMLALDTKDGKVIWKKATDGWVWAGPALVENKLYFGDLMGVFYALNASDGSQIWKTEPETGSTSGISDRPLVIQGTIYFSSENGDLYAVDAAKGSVTWNKTIGGKLYGAPVQAGNLILVAPVGADSLVYAVDANGNQQWTFKPAKK